MEVIRLKFMTLLNHTVSRTIHAKLNWLPTLRMLHAMELGSVKIAQLQWDLKLTAMLLLLNLCLLLKPEQSVELITSSTKFLLEDQLLVELTLMTH